VSDGGLPPDPGGALPLGDGISRGRLRRTAPLAALSARTAGEAVVVGLRSKLAGQMLSFVSAGPAVPTEFQSIYQVALRRLRDDAPPMAPELARAVLERELERRTESTFAQFDWTPLAAASIGQVHAARLHDGRAVAVKIQYPGVAAAIGADLKNSELLSTFLGLMFGLSPKKLSLDFRSMAREISARIEEELDYRLEAANQTEFADIYRGHPFIHVPEVIGELCTDRVLTQELVRGSCWNEALAADQSLRDQWAEAIHRFVYGSYYRWSLFNADPHPGNYVFHDDGSVSFLDFGSVKRLRRERVEMFVAIYRECFRGDVLGTWRASVEAGMWRSSDPVTPEEVFAYWREDNALVWAHQHFVATPDSVGRGIERRFSPTGPSANVLRHCTMPPEYALLVRAEIGVASVIAQLRAGNNWGSFAAEYCENAAPVTAMGKLDHAFFAERQAASSHA
jgi:hypothetical protein